MSPKLSIIVPVYKVEKYLDRCIQSLLSQTLKDVEIILVDDGSPDASPSICDKYVNDNPNIFVIHKKNEGLGMARNSGLELAKGEYVTFCDSDDWVDSDAYQHVYNICIEKKLDMCCFQYRRVTLDGKIIEMPKVSSKFFSGENEVKNFLLNIIGRDYSNPESVNYGMSSCMALFRRSIFLTSGVRYPSERKIASEDFVFLLYFLPYVKSVGIIPNVYYNYMINPTSITQHYSEAKHDRLLATLYELKSYCESNMQWEEYKNHYFSQQLRIFKVILKYISLSNEPFFRKIRHLTEETKNPILNDFYHDPVRKYYDFANRIYIYCMKYHYGCFFALFYKFRR